MLPITLLCYNAIMSPVVVSTTAVMVMSEPTREYECCQLKETSITMSGGIQKCYDQGQRLINVKTVAQNNAIMGQVTSSFSKYWIGIYQSDKGTSLVSSESMTIICRLYPRHTGDAVPMRCLYGISRSATAMIAGVPQWFRH